MSGYVRQLAEQARVAAAIMATTDATTRRRLIEGMAAQLESSRDAILAANAEDLARGREAGLSSAMLDRLMLDGARLLAVANALRDVAAQPDPLGQVTRREVRPNGVVVERQRVPLGLIAMIYEARPNVTADAAALCLKAGNAVLLRGGSEARASNGAIASCLHAALRAEGVPGLMNGYQNIHLLPVFRRKIAHGTTGFPWTASPQGDAITYAPGLCPVAEELHACSFLGLALCLCEYEPQDVDRVIEAFLPG